MNDFCANLRQEEVKQVMRIARLEDRTQVGGLGQLELLGKPRDSECAWIENVSDHGARVISRRRWRAGERLLITSRFPPFHSTPASVVYCQTLLEGLYAIGCESTMGGILQLLERTAEDSNPTDAPALENSAGCGGGLSHAAPTKS
jgi:hypothetical protein